MENHTKGQINRFGVWVNGQFRWIDDGGWSRRLLYEHDTLVTKVELTHKDLPVRLLCHHRWEGAHDGPFAHTPLNA